MDLKYFTNENIPVLVETSESVYELQLIADDHNRHEEPLKWFSRPSYQQHNKLDSVENTIFFTSLSKDGCFYVIEK